MLINVMYAEDCDDCDIIYVPDEIGNEIESCAQQFCNWLGSDCITDDHYTVVDGKKYISLETEGFVDWINNYVCNGDAFAYIQYQHVSLNPKYKTVDF